MVVLSTRSWCKRQSLRDSQCERVIESSHSWQSSCSRKDDIPTWDGVCIHSGAHGSMFACPPYVIPHLPLEGILMGGEEGCIKFETLKFKLDKQQMLERSFRYTVIVLLTSQGISDNLDIQCNLGSLRKRLWRHFAMVKTDVYLPAVEDNTVQEFESLLEQLLDEHFW